jgi:hypothetical protein
VKLRRRGQANLELRGGRLLRNEEQRAVAAAASGGRLQSEGGRGRHADQIRRYFIEEGYVDQ